MIATLTITSLLIAAPLAAQAQSTSKPTQEEYQKALVEQLTVSKLRHAALDAADRKEIPYLKEFLALYPDAIIQYLSFEGAEFPSLSVTTTLHGRYEFNMRLPVAYSKDNQTITGYGQPQCHLTEAESIAPRGNELGEISFGDLEKHFGEKEWKALVEAKGDFSALGYQLKKDAPVPNFALVIKYLKSLERKVPKPAEEHSGSQSNPRQESK